MQPINVANLNKALLFLAGKTPAQPTVVPGIKQIAELKDAVSKNLAVFDDNTKQLLMHVQTNAGLPPTGELDETTAAKINALLQEHGRFATPSVEVKEAGDGNTLIALPVNGGDPQSKLSFTIEGYVTTSAGLPVANVIVKAFDKDLRSKETIGEIISSENGYYLISYDANAFARHERKLRTC